ncbi:hypothetical protein DPMN_110088 [Dreissena polymorpha]|uniref:Uncharacterized protein n=1 Tax=Dreissena polymorpha TaxID=45954 RepID=A0A9D4QMT6_DREPO|nr:hypothetical protein DPMN_110088 [Dreissena polymorpha]
METLPTQSFVSKLLPTLIKLLPFTKPSVKLPSLPCMTSVDSNPLKTFSRCNRNSAARAAPLEFNLITRNAQETSSLEHRTFSSDVIPLASAKVT